jgi:hypothetical protein
MLELTRALFADHLESKFRLDYGSSEPMEVELTQVAALDPRNAPKPANREPFSLIFRGPRTFCVPQRIYKLDHEKLGTLEIFLVPIGPDEKGMRYEAVFN